MRYPPSFIQNLEHLSFHAVCGTSSKNALFQLLISYFFAEDPAFPPIFLFYLYIGAAVKLA